MKKNDLAQGHIILVEDDKELAFMTKDFLTKNGFKITLIDDGLSAVKKTLSIDPDLVVLDIMLPGLSGMDVCKKIRKSYTGPIIMLTALDEDMDQILGLELGADDYIVKPVHPRLLLTRIRALLRRTKKTINHYSNLKDFQNTYNLKAGRLSINLNQRIVSFKGKVIELTTAEFELLLLLFQNLGQVVNRETIVRQLRGFEYDGLDRSIDRRISRLRKKIQEIDPYEKEVIKTIRGQGYQLCIEIDEEPKDNIQIGSPI